MFFVEELASAHFFVAGVACFAGVILSRYAHRPRLPPGPPGLPIVGNLFNMPTENEWLVYAEWVKKYGNIMSISVLGQVIVILDSAHDVRELLVKRSAQSSDRLRLIMPAMSGWGDTIGLLAPEKLRIVKKFSTKTLGQHAMQCIVDVVEKEATSYIERQIQAFGKVDPSAQIKRLAGGTVLRIAFGYQVQSDDDPFVKLSEEALETFFFSIAPGWAVDAFPWLQHFPEWLPGMEFKRKAKQWRKVSEDCHSALLNWTKKQIESGTAEPSLAADILTEPDSAANDALLLSAIGDLYAAGTDTTGSVCLTLILNLALHPDMQAKAQREVDSVTLGERLPTYSDRGSLPYVNALVKEAYRFGPIVPLALPHRMSQATEYKGYSIPENAIILANVWSILHNDAKYPDPSIFNPDRYLGDVVMVDGEVINEDPSKYVFGFGARQCPGRFLADAVVFLLAAKLLATCTVSGAVDARGNPIPPHNIKYASSTLSAPEPFKCTVEPRENAKN